MDYIKPLDGLRAIAVLLVIISHWFWESHFLNIYTSFFNGVDIFFLLSGFLITKILLENKSEAAKLGSSRKVVLVNFFFRRTLRIFPIYYLTLFTLYPFSDFFGIGLKDNFIYFITYTSNFYFMAHGWDGIVSHLWSLAVEEQFYLFWPWIVLLTPHKKIPLIFILTFVIGLVTNMMYTDIFTVACLDGFGAGAILAYIIIYRAHWTEKYKHVFLALAILGISLQFLRVLTPFNGLIPSRTLTSLFTFWLIIQLMAKEGRFANYAQKFFSLTPLMFMGRISYGIYIFHLIIPAFSIVLYTRINDLLGYPIISFSTYLLPFLDLMLVIFISYLSWIWIEKPILGFKKYFNYQTKLSVKEVKVLTKL